MDYCQTGLNTEIPWREWIQFDVAAIKVMREHLYYFTLPEQANDFHSDVGRVGNWKTDNDPWSYHTLFKPKGDFSLVAGADKVCTIGLYYSLTKDTISWPAVENYSPDFYVLGEPAGGGIDYRRVTSKKYDGVNLWPHDGGGGPPPRLNYSWGANMHAQTQPPVDQCLACLRGPPWSGYCPDVSDLHHSGFEWLFLRGPGGTLGAPRWQEEFFRTGGILSVMHWYEPGQWTFPANGEIATYFSNIERTKVYYFNPVVNSISPVRYPTAGTDFVLNGIGFQIPDAWLQAYEWGATNYRDHVYEVQFIGREGQGTFTATSPVHPSFNWIMTNTQITIPAAEMPTLPTGSYWIRLIKHNQVVAIGDSEGYAGDWKTAADGRMTRGTRFVFLVQDTKIPVDPPLPFFEWGWKWGDLTIKERYAPIDTRATATFWDGRIQGLSSLTRSIDDKTGLFNISDVNVELANQDMHFSQLLANYFCKGQLVQMAHGRGLEPEAWHQSVFFAMVDDHNLKGPEFNVKLKDYAHKFMKGQQPRYTVTRAEYPDCKEAAVGQPIQELLGRHSFTAGSAPGAIQAHCTDDPNHIYICARGPLHAFLNVYSNGTAVNPADYATFIDATGRQFIQFDDDQGDNKITFNCEGYMFGDWNSPNGYIQNPAYIIAFYWAMLLEIPVDFIDLDSVNEMAAFFDDAGIGEIGKLHIIALEEKGAILQKLLFSFGIKYWQSKTGLLKLGRKDIASLATSIFIHAQIEVQDIPDRAYNLEEAVNSVKAQFNHFPAADLYEGAIEQRDESSIERFGAEMSPSSPWLYPFITDADFCEQRVLEDLLKFSYGDKSIKFDLPLEMIDDIDIFDNFQLQDPYGISATKSGEIGRYYYVISLTYNWEGETIGVVAIDLQWLLQQYFIFGDEDEMPNLWEDASDHFRYYGYLCDEDTEEFSDGFRGKVLIDENLLEQE